MPWIDAARIAAVFAVVMLHASAYYVTGIEIGSSAWWWGNILDSLSRWCVPVFVMISGALLLDTRKNEPLLEFYAKRALRIGPPLVAWSVIFMVWNMSKAAIIHGDVGYFSKPRQFFGFPAHYHLWYLYMVVSLYLLTPLLRMLTRAMTRVQAWWLTGFLILAAALAQGWKILNGPSPVEPFFLWFLPYLGYFFAGHLIATSTYRPQPLHTLAFFGASVCLTAMGCFVLSKMYKLEIGLYFYDYLSITVIPMALSAMWLFKLLPLHRWPQRPIQWAANLALGIYLVHPIFLESLREFVLTPEARLPAPALVLVTLLVFLASAAASWIISKTPLLRNIA